MYLDRQNWHLAGLGFNDTKTRIASLNSRYIVILYQFSGLLSNVHLTVPFVPDVTYDALRMFNGLLNLNWSMIHES